MADESLSNRWHGLLARIRRLDLLLAQGLMILLLLATNTVNFETFDPPEVLYSQQDAANLDELDRTASAWEDRSLYSIRSLDGVDWILWAAPPLPADLDQPLSIHLSGPFSAEVFWNGALIGFKGEPAADPRAERAGPIDTAIAIPPGSLRESGNEIALRLSSTRAGYTPALIVQNLQVGPYVADARRSLRYYLGTLVLTGAILAIGGALVLLSRSSGEALPAWLAGGMLALLIAIGAEISRAFIAYPYDWHQPRQAISFAGIGAFCLVLLNFVTRRWPWPGNATRRVTLIFAAVVTTLAIAQAFSESGWDHRSSWFSVILIGAAAVWAFIRGLREQPDALAFALALAVIPVYAMQLPGDYLDRALYALTASLFGTVLLVRRTILVDMVAESVSGAPAKDPVIDVQATGKTIFIPLAAITHLKASGNYTEIHRADGRWELDNRSLKALMDDLPAGSFLRVHRSHAVKIDCIASLASAEGSRYAITLTNGQTLPVGRSRITAIRQALAGRD